MSLREPLVAVTTCLCLAAPVCGDAWARFRGANGDGQAAADEVPNEFTAADYAWRAPLPGVGHSSPVVWGARVFVTSANVDTGEQTILCFDLSTGDEQWQRRFPAATHPRHLTNSFATSTPAVDGERLYVAWMNGQTVTLAALTLDGDDVWQRPVGRLDEQHGFGTSPVVVGNVVCLAKDTDVAADSEIVGLDRRTGDVLWRTPCGLGKTSYATPCVWQSPEGRTLILMPTMGAGLTAYEPTTGKVAWNVLAHDLPDRCVSSPILAGDLALVSCGSGNNGLHLIALQLGAAGDPPHEAYRIKQNVPNIPTPVTAGDLLFLWHDRGTVSCLDAATGASHWRQRIGGNYHSSPLRLGERILAVSLDGEVVVLAASKEYRLLGRSKLDEPVTATPAAAAGRLLIRTEQSLICLGGRP